MYVPDNYDAFQQHEKEQTRIDRLRKRKQLEYEKEEYECQHYTNLPDNFSNY